MASESFPAWVEALRTDEGEPADPNTLDQQARFIQRMLFRALEARTAAENDRSAASELQEHVERRMVDLEGAAAAVANAESAWARRCGLKTEALSPGSP